MLNLTHCLYFTLSKAGLGVTLRHSEGMSHGLVVSTLTSFEDVMEIEATQYYCYFSPPVTVFGK